MWAAVVTQPKYRAAIAAAGFGIEQIDRFSYARLRFIPTHSHILGRARTGRLSWSARFWQI